MKAKVAIIYLIAVASLTVAVEAKVNLIGQGDGITVTATEKFTSSGFAPVSNLVGTNGMLNLSAQGYLTLSSITDPSSNYTSTWAQPNNTAAPGWINFEFSENVSLTQIAIWNCSFMTQRGVPSGSFTYSTGNNTTGIGNQLWSGNINLSSINDGNSPVSDLISFSQIDNVKALRFYYNASASDYTVIHKFAFIGSASTIPEPSTYGLIGIGALGVAFTARRRKQKTA
jgi:hypothetical protein